MALKEETAYARMIYKFGEGNLKPVKNIKRLSELSGCPVETIRKHVPQWRKECEQLAVTSTSSPYSLSLSEETLVQHKTEIDFLGEQVEKLRLRLSKLTTNCPEYHVVIGSYQSALTKWEKASGITGHMDNAMAAMRETVKAQAKAKAKDVKDPSKRPRKVNGKRFQTD